MAYNIKSVLKLFLVFLYFQILLNTIVILVPEMNSNLTDNEILYLEHLSKQTDPTKYFDGRQADVDSSSLIQEFRDTLNSERTFDDNLLNTFLGILKITWEGIKFIVKLCLAIAVVPSIIMNILLFNFAGNTTIILSSMVIVNLGFYSWLYYIVFKEGGK